MDCTLKFCSNGLCFFELKWASEDLQVNLAEYREQHFITLGDQPTLLRLCWLCICYTLENDLKTAVTHVTQDQKAGSFEWLQRTRLKLTVYVHYCHTNFFTVDKSWAAVMYVQLMVHMIDLVSWIRPSLDDVNRLDQTLGKPSIWMLSSEKEKQRMTVVSRLSRVELQVSCTVCWLRYDMIRYGIFTCAEKLMLWPA